MRHFKSFPFCTFTRYSKVLAFSMSAKLTLEIEFLPERSWKILFLADWVPESWRPFLCLFGPFWVCSRWHCSCFEPPSFYPKDKSTYWYMRIVQLFAESYSACFLHTPRNQRYIYREKKTHKSVRKAWKVWTLTICQKLFYPRCLKITEKVSFYIIASEASYVYSITTDV